MKRTLVHIADDDDTIEHMINIDSRKYLNLNLTFHLFYMNENNQDQIHTHTNIVVFVVVVVIEDSSTSETIFDVDYSMIMMCVCACAYLHITPFLKKVVVGKGTDTACRIVFPKQHLCSFGPPPSHQPPIYMAHVPLTDSAHTFIGL